MVEWETIKRKKDFNGNVAHYVFRNKNHEMALRRVNKLALKTCDEKRKTLNNIKSLPWF